MNVADLLNSIEGFSEASTHQTWRSFGRDVLVGIEKPDGSIQYSVEVIQTKDPIFKKDIVVLRQHAYLGTNKVAARFEIVNESGEGNTWPFKVIRKHDKKCLGKFKGAHIAALFCDFLEQHHDDIVERQMNWAKAQNMRDSLI